MFSALVLKKIQVQPADSIRLMTVGSLKASTSSCKYMTITQTLTTRVASAGCHWIGYM